jgi:phosphoribosylanthranilate isomerase
MMIIKVCGLREPENIRALEAVCDIDFMGFIFYPPSKRYLSDNREVIDAVRRCGKKKVGVFVNETVENMQRKAELYCLDYLQLHGAETPGACDALRTEGYGVIKTFSIASASDFETADSYRGCVDYLLFDTKSAAYGGFGKRFDWTLLNKYNTDIPFLLSGGLSPDCLQDILSFRHHQFAGLDINSGFELSPGIKDAKLIKGFVEALVRLNGTL